MELRGQVRSQVQLGNEEQASCRLRRFGLGEMGWLMVPGVDVNGPDARTVGLPPVACGHPDNTGTPVVAGLPEEKAQPLVFF